MPSLIGSRIEHPGQTLIVGHGGQLYAPHTSMDAWCRTRQTQKVTKYRIVALWMRATLHRPRRPDEDLSSVQSARATGTKRPPRR